MFKNLSKKLFSGMALVLTLVAYTGVSPYSMWILYEPDAPKSLMK